MQSLTAHDQHATHGFEQHLFLIKAVHVGHTGNGQLLSPLQNDTVRHFTASFLLRHITPLLTAKKYPTLQYMRERDTLCAVYSSLYSADASALSVCSAIFSTSTFIVR